MLKFEFGVFFEKLEDLGIIFLYDSNDWSWGIVIFLDKCVRFSVLRFLLWVLLF